MERNTQEHDVGRMIRSTILVITTHALIPLLWIVFVVFIAPMFIAEFAKTGFEIPVLTVAFIKFSAFICRYWFLYLFILLLFLVADGSVYFSLLRSSGKSPASLWSMLVLLGEGIFTVLCIVLLCLPLMRIITRNE